MLYFSGHQDLEKLHCSNVYQESRNQIAENINVDGKVYYDKNKKINLPVQKRNLGYVFQNYTLFPHMNVKKIYNVVSKIGKRK